MTARGSWKQAERRICRELGGERTPLSGENSRHTSADCIEIPEYCEIKMQPDPTAHEHLDELSDKARRYDRRPVVLYDHPDGLTWAAFWLDTYTTFCRTDDGTPSVGDWTWYYTDESGYMVRHEVGKRLPHRALVEDTITQARDEGRPPLVVLQKKGSPRRVALVPLTTEDHA